MELEELSKKEIKILEALTDKSYPGVKQIAEQTGSEYEDILRIMNNPKLIENFKKSRLQKEIEKEMEKIGDEEEKLKTQEKSLISKRNMRQEKENNETKILGAICDKECRSIKSISDVTGIRYKKIRKIIYDANLLTELRNMRKKEDCEKARNNYRRGMTIDRLAEIIGIKAYRLSRGGYNITNIRKYLIQEQRNLTGILHQIILKRAEKEDPVFHDAYVYYTKPSTKLSFEEIYNRFKDIAKNYFVSECGRRWNVSRQASSSFIKYIGMKKIYRQEVKKAKEKLTNEQKNLAYILHQIILKRAEKEDPVFHDAYVYYSKPYTILSFEEIYNRFKDVYEGCTIAECGKRWGKGYFSAYAFINRTRIKGIGIQKACH